MDEEMMELERTESDMIEEITGNRRCGSGCGRPGADERNRADTVEGQLWLGRFSKEVGSCACLFYVLSFTLLCFNCHLYMADGCTGGGRRTGVRGLFLLNVLTKLFLLSEIVWMTGVGSHVNC